MTPNELETGDKRPLAMFESFSAAVLYIILVWATAIEAVTFTYNSNNRNVTVYLVLFIFP